MPLKEKCTVTESSPEMRDKASHLRPQEKHHILLRKQKACDRGKRCLYWFFLRKGKFGGRVNSLILASLNNFVKLQAIGVLSNCLVPDPGINKAEDYCLPGYTGQTEEV